MPKPIFWSPLSEKDFSEILIYLDNEWGEIVVNQFIDNTDLFLKQIFNNPRQDPKKLKFK